MSLLEDVPAETLRERSIPVLETERLVLRAPRPEDAKAVAMLANDRRIAENLLRVPHPYRLADAEAFIASVNRSETDAIFLATLPDDTIIGSCGVDYRERIGYELGYWFAVPYWGNGYATEAARAVLDHAFTTLGCDALASGARVSNPASRRVLEKCGFQWTGVGLYRIPSIKSSAPVDRFRLDRGLWASLKSWGRARHVA